MLKIHGAHRSYTLLLMWGLGIIILFGLRSSINSTNPPSPGLLIESKTFAGGKSLSITEGSSFYRVSLGLLPKTHELEFRVINQTLMQKGLVMQQYQQSPYALLLTIYQDFNVANREKTLMQASSLIPTNHPLQKTLSFLKSL